MRLIAAMLEHAEWGMSPAAFDRDWPSPTLEADGVFHFGPKGSVFGYGTALTYAAAEAQRQRIRSAEVRGCGLVWC